MIRFWFGAVLGLIVGTTVTIGVIYFERHGNQPYAGQDSQVVSSLSPDDIRQLRNGEGWGLAKPAELNGFPGSLHVLELAEELNLQESQREQVQAVFDNMRSQAKTLGPDLIEAETQVDAAFRSGVTNGEILNKRLRAAEIMRAQLRAVHLEAHLKITPLLTAKQRQLYAELRGYSPDGHASHEGH